MMSRISAYAGNYPGGYETETILFGYMDALCLLGCRLVVYAVITVISVFCYMNWG